MEAKRKALESIVQKAESASPTKTEQDSSPVPKTAQQVQGEYPQTHHSRAIFRGIRRRVRFTSVADLRRKLMKYTRAYTTPPGLFLGPIPIPSTVSALNQS